MTTLQQVKLDIASGKALSIYMSAHTLWWTHSEADVKSATKAGREYIEAKRKRIAENPKITAKAKEVSEILFKRVSEFPDLPIDPTGSPLMIVDEPLSFLDELEETWKKENGPSMDDFMKQHHQNCGGKTYASYDEFKKQTQN